VADLVFHLRLANKRYVALNDAVATSNVGFDHVLLGQCNVFINVKKNQRKGGFKMKRMDEESSSVFELAL